MSIKAYFWLVILIAFSYLHSLPEYITSFPNLEIRENFGSIIDFVVEKDNVYLLDYKEGEILTYSTILDSVTFRIKIKKILNKPSKLLLHNDLFYIANTGENNITILNKEGEIVKSIGNKPGSYADLKSPIDIEVNIYNQIYVLDKAKKELLLYNEHGFFLRSLIFKNPLAICLDLSQNIHVLQQSKEKTEIEIFDNYLNKIRTITELNVSRALGSKISDLKINKFGEYYISDNSNCFFLKLNSSGEEIWTFGVRSNDPQPGYFKSTQAVIIIPDGETENIYFLDRKHGLIQQYTESSDVARNILEEPIFPILFEFADNAKYCFNDLLFIEDKIYVLNSSEPSFYCQKGDQILFKVDKQTAKEKGIKFSKPEKMVSNGDFIFITDSGSNQVHVFNFDGSYIRFFGEKGKEEGKLNNPTGIVIDHDGNLCIADCKNNRLSIFSKKGIFQKCYKNDALISPTDLTINSKGELFVLSSNSSVYRIDAEYNTFIKLPLSTSKISAVECIINDITIIVDQEKQKLILLEENLDLLMELGCKGSKKDSDQFAEINAIGFKCADNLIFGNDKAAKNSKILKMLIRPDSPQNITLKPLGDENVRLSWDNAQNAFEYFVYCRKSIEADPVLKQKVKINEFVIKENSVSLLDYTVTAVSLDSLESESGSWITDSFSYGKYLEENSNLGEAAEVFYQLYEADPDFNYLRDRIIGIYNRISENYKKSRNYDNALVYLQKALLLNPEDTDLIMAQIQIYKLSKTYQEGIDFLKNTALETLNKEEYCRTLTSLFYLNKKYQQVIEITLQYRLNNTPSLEINKLLARSYEKLHMYLEALPIFEEIAESGLNENIINVAKILVKLNRFEEAILLYKKVISSGYSNSNIFFQLGVTYYENGKLGDAAIQFERAIKKNPDDPDNYYYLGKTYFSDKKVQEAIKSFDMAINLDSTRYEYSYDLAQTFKILNRFDEAIAALQRAVIYVPGDSVSIPVHVELGKLLMIKKDYDSALYEFDIAYNLFPESAEIHKLLAKSRTARKEYNKTREPIEIEKIIFDNVFPSLKEYYQTHPIASITLFNTRDIPVEDILLEMEIENICEKNWELIVSSVLSNESQNYPVNLIFNDTLLTASLAGEKTMIAKIKASYNFLGKQYNIETNREFKVLSCNAISWENKKQIASFINPLDPVIRDFVLNKIISPFDEKSEKTTFNKTIKQAIQLYSYLTEFGIHYVSDPNQAVIETDAIDVIDYVQPAIQTFKDKGGDCEDLVVLLSNIMESIGIRTAYIDVPGHVLVAFDTGMSKNEAADNGFDPKMFIVTENKCWMPIEATLLGKESFYRSWISGMERYNKILQKGLLPEIFIIADAHHLFPAAHFKGEITAKDQINFTVVLDNYKSDLNTFIALTSKSLELEYLEILEKYPENNHVKNRLAKWYVANEKPGKANQLLKQILDDDENNIVALNNLANLELKTKNYDRASELYIKALDILKKDDGLFQNLAVLELKRENRDKARFYFFKIENKEALRKTNPQLITEILKK